MDIHNQTAPSRQKDATHYNDYIIFKNFSPLMILNGTRETVISYVNTLKVSHPEDQYAMRRSRNVF